MFFDKTLFPIHFCFLQPFKFSNIHTKLNFYQEKELCFSVLNSVLDSRL